MPEPRPGELSLYLASPCYGGVATARFMRSLLALRAECAERGLRLQLDLGGGEALTSRARAGMMSRFLTRDASHLLFADSEAQFTPPEVFSLLNADQPIVSSSDGERLFLIRRDAAEAITAAHPDLQARIGDIAGLAAPPAAMVFESMIDATGNYLTDLAAFRARWEVTKGPAGSIPHG